MNIILETTQGTQQTPGRDGGSAEHGGTLETGVLPAWTIEYFKANPLSVTWQFMLAIGGVILALHFVYIGFFPDMDWQSSLALVAIVALTGLLVWCVICLMLVFPAFTWSVVLEELEKKSETSTETEGDHSGEPLARADTSTPEQGSPTPFAPVHSSPPKHPAGEPGQARPDTTPGDGSRVKGPVMGRLAVLFGLPTLMLWLAIVAIIALDEGEVYDSWWLMTLVTIVTPLLFTLVAYRVAQGGDALGPRFNRMGYWRYFFAAMIGSIVFVAPVALTHTLTYSQFSHTPGKAIVFTVAALLAFLFNLAVFRRWLAGSARRTSLGLLPQAALLGTFGLASLIAMTGNWVLLSEGVAYLYGIGNLEGATLVLDKEGCGVASKAGLGPELDAEGEWCRLPGVNILNRLGTTYYVRSPRGGNFTLLSSSVKSYELPPPAVATIHLEPTVEAGVYKLVVVTVTNKSGVTLNNVIVDAEFRDVGGRLTQSHRLYLNELPAGQRWRGEVTPTPSTAVDSNCRVVLTRYGRRLPYEVK